jgi:hypothetical protein
MLSRKKIVNRRFQKDSEYAGCCDSHCFIAPTMNNCKESDSHNQMLTKIRETMASYSAGSVVLDTNGKRISGVEPLISGGGCPVVIGSALCGITCSRGTFAGNSGPAHETDKIVRLAFGVV